MPDTPTPAEAREQQPDRPITTAAAEVVAYEPSLGRLARVGSWAELSGGTFATATEHLRSGRGEAAAELVEVSVEEAQELREVYQLWPERIEAWVRARAQHQASVNEGLRRLDGVLGAEAMGGIEAGWPRYVDAAAHAAALCRAHTPPSDSAPAAAAVEQARRVWQRLHDQAVDRVSGMVDLAVRVCGEHCLGALWDHLMSDWYELHAQRYDLSQQSWPESAHQLMTAIVDGFHAHLSGADRQGDIELIEEPDRIGFRFAPCGSGGRSLSAGITAGAPRAGAPYGWATTTEQHDWAWNRVGVCSYCVHCCQLNVVMPIDRLGYPTRVIDPPTWPATTANPSCTWWVYRHPSLIPDEVYTEVGRHPDRRPPRPAGAEANPNPRTPR